MSDTTCNFADIAPIDDSQFHQYMLKMISGVGLEHAIKYILPNVNYPEFLDKLRNIKTRYAFHHEIMWPCMEMLAKRTTSGVTISGLENIKPGRAATFITNHRDIVLDASFLNICFFRNGLPPCEVAIGSNLLILPWIDILVKLNGCFVVKRDLPRLAALDAAKQLSAYIRHAIVDKNSSLWIAQREGRAKDSSDATQPSLIKMMSLAGEGSIAQRLSQINLTPISIAYEYDPNDYLKVREFLLKRRDPDFKKTKLDDLFSMETGLLQYKGRVHFNVTPCLSDQIARLPEMDRQATIDAVCRLIDAAIHKSYKIYAINYIAYDLLTQSTEFEMLYTRHEREGFIAYVEHQLDKVDVEAVTPEEREYMQRMMFTMYANPLKNKLQVNGY